MAIYDQNASYRLNHKFYTFLYLVYRLLVEFHPVFFCHEGYQNYVSYPDKICDHPEEKWYYVFVNEDILKSPRMESYNSYSKNKDMYSLNSRILKSKNCDPNKTPTTFH